MLSFVYQSAPSRVIFGVGSLDKLPDEIQKLGATKALVLSTPEQRQSGLDMVTRLGVRAAGLFDRAVMHVPIETAQAAREEAKRLAADCCVAVGGGSTTGLAKAIALVSTLPILAVPTTYAGSEMTPIWGITENGHKTTGRDIRVLPKTVLYDPCLTITMPAMLSATSGMNSIAHCVEALYAQEANPIISLMAEEGIRAFAQSLPVVVKEPGNLEARSQALYAAWLGGIALSTVGMALHHKLCHTLGGTYNLPHAETHTVVLPHAVAYNTPAAPEAMSRIARALGTRSAAEGLYDLAARLGAPTSLAALGMKAGDLDQAADIAVQNPYYNPRPITRDGIRALLQAAFEGRRP
ncbi:MAG TPA: maleylacetate reductase [Bryobacteraceae bacterium]|jgi:alcohol dehydrogenase class IV|nr:maleylacetate reductase [Bryobacteraceae bacterium]